MNKFKYLTFAIAMVLPFGLQSCLNNEDDIRDRPTALVTVVPQKDGGFVMNLDDATVLIPTNMRKSPYGDKEVRAWSITLRTAAEPPNDESKWYG